MNPFTNSKLLQSMQKTLEHIRNTNSVPVTHELQSAAERAAKEYRESTVKTVEEKSKIYTKHFSSIKDATQDDRDKFLSIADREYNK